MVLKVLLMMGKNLHLLDSIPAKLEDNVFIQVFETAEIAKFSKEEYRDYEDSLKYYSDLKNSLDTAEEEGFSRGKEEGIKEGRKEEKIEIAKKGLEAGYPLEIIANMTGLTAEEIENLSK